MCWPRVHYPLDPASSLCPAAAPPAVRDAMSKLSGNELLRDLSLRSIKVHQTVQLALS